MPNRTLAAAILAAIAAQAHAAPIMGDPASFSQQDKARLVSALNNERGMRGLDSDHGFVIASQHPGARGTAISRMQHTYKGVRVFESESVVVSDEGGNIVSESVADRRKDLAAKRMSVKPRFQQKEAIKAALRAVGAYSAQIDAPSAELIIYPVMKTQRVPEALNKAESELNALDVVEVVDSYKLAYLVQTRMANGNQPVYHNTIVGADDGAVLEQWSMLQHVVGTGNSQYSGVVPINTTLSGTTYRMADATRGTRGTFGAMAVTNANHTTSAGSVYTNTSNTWGDGKQYIAGGSTTNANGQTAAVNAMWGLMNTYDMHKNVLGWQSLDGNNTATYIAAHVNTAYDNAYYSDTCKCMYIGDGGSYFNSLGAIDVIGHEMGHGITAATSSLVYRGESGGLNESASDIAGEAVEAYARAGGTGAVLPSPGTNDWVLGKEISKSGQPLRWMYKPSKDGRSPDAWSTTLKSLDVHYSSGPNNRMFYFLARGSSASGTSEYYSKYLTKAPLAMTGIGLDKAYRIWFKALTTKFTSSTGYADARLKVLAAAQELYGVNSAEAKAVQRAYAAINVGSDIAE
ncbi:M4 family metallopeptidase [Pseudoduganella namucuonensis]|uniref:Neutral metalloproteinase n=1 Tax=Pseudoduganella namucuonensis TaxID=1035707 RepID=A0A1I7L927_9BURK|nr:M4 family metallopeptidase [Pseudoduganella namucuonensis]SFV06227.1 Zn-dependent metalloprotease [Pseudoduganella namucuonensis]